MATSSSAPAKTSDDEEEEEEEQEEEEQEEEEEEEKKHSQIFKNRLTNGCLVVEQMELTIIPNTQPLNTIC